MECFTFIRYLQNPYVHRFELKYLSFYCGHPLHFSISRKVSPSRWRLFPATKDALLQCDFRTVRTTCCINGNFQSKAVEIMPNAEIEKLYLERIRLAV